MNTKAYITHNIYQNNGHSDSVVYTDVVRHTLYTNMAGYNS